MDVMYVCTGIPDGEWASKGCRLTWNREWGGQCPVCRGIVKPVAVKTVTPNIKGETAMTTITNGPVIPVIPNNVADAIESFRRDKGNASIVEIVQRKDANVTERLAAVRSIPFDTLLAALVNGYERELITPKVGDWVRITNAKGGCSGATGKDGIVTDEVSSNGLMGYSDGINVKITYSKAVWRVNKDALTLMPEVNA